VVDLTPENPTIEHLEHPKKIDYWYFAHTEKLLHGQIALLRHELSVRQSELSELTKLIHTPEEVHIKPDNERATMPVGKMANPARKLAEMEDIERRRYWEDQIKLRESIKETEGNIIEAES